MAISKLHSLLALTGLAAASVPVTAVFILNSQKKTDASNNANSGTETTPTTAPTTKTCTTPDTSKGFWSNLYKNIVGETTSGTEPNPTKLKKWEEFIKRIGKDCQDNALTQTTTSGTGAQA